MRYEPFSLRLASPLDTAAGRIERRDGFLVRVERDGVDGVGEATPLPGWTESYEACDAALAEVVSEAPEAEVETAAAELSAEARPAARHGLGLATVDAEARAVGESLATYLAADSPATSVPVNATVGDGTVAETAAATREAVEDGYPAVKVKVGARTPEEDEARLRAARDVAGEHVELRADANGAWTASTARRMLGVAADLDFAYVEQPLPAADIGGHAELRGRGVDVALDESLAAVGPDGILDAGAADVLVCKPMALGGPRRTLDVARRAARRGVDTVVTTTIDAVVARVGALHVAAALPDVRACGLATGSLLADDVGPDPAPVEDGAMSVPTGPGLAGETFETLRK
ncbi:o-succinylbenzoate synthase [Halobellus sp. Atlit-38R]|uniref:mandelate racemase/muconate lactonizing enzyme family protein n=1 Tax=Halobellus sp. Atlit-38R TaxID=2282131 RepID=UPI000EF2614C|nr:o-succinylbenzoate synthase [Halobellus sp. Atlit-38R]RLM88298.1 o-succinylbenzoate synthase [Halobellus sp. Atlit-38R]